MPIYQYECSECGREADAVRPIDDRHDGPVCECGTKMAMVIVPPRINRTFLGSSRNPGYESPMSGKFISSASQRRDEMKRFNVIEAR